MPHELSKPGVGLNNIAGILQVRGEFADAVEHYRRAVTTLARSLGPEHPTTRAVRANLAHTLTLKSGRAPDDESGATVVRPVGDGQRVGGDLKTGDWIRRYGGQSVRNARHLATLAAQEVNTRTVEVLLVRDGKELTVELTGGPVGAETQ